MHSCLCESTDSPVNGVRLWTAHLEALSPAEVEELSAHLDPAERARAEKFHFERDRRHYVTARGLLRELLGAALNEHASAVVFEYGAHGKPALAGVNHPESRLCFNLSHSAGWAMFAIVQNREVGIDLENAARLDQTDEDLFHLAARVLSAGELAIWQTLPQPAAGRAAFLRAWTRKEAYAKATGRGVFEALTRIEVVLDATAPRKSLTIRSSAGSDGLTNDWLMHDLVAPEGFAAALAVAERSEEDVACGDEAELAAMDHA